MDLTQSITPKSDQINAEDLLTGPRTFTIEKVTAGSAEQPVDFHLVELPGRAYRPSKSMRRVIVNAWGKESAEYTGRRLTLYRDPEVTFGRDKVGGIKISHLSDIPKPVSLALTVTRGKRAMHTVQPLPREFERNAVTVARGAEQVAEHQAMHVPTLGAKIAASSDQNELRDMWQHATPDMRALIEARVAELNGAES